MQELAQGELLAQQACYLPTTDDGLPLIGRVPGLENAYASTGHRCAWVAGWVGASKTGGWVVSILAQAWVWL